MKTKLFLAAAVATAALVAACGDDPGALTEGGGRQNSGNDGNINGNTPTPAPAGGETTTPSTTDVPTNSPEGKAFFAASVQPGLATACGACHDNGVGPTWMSRTDANVSYTLMFAAGYVSKTSRVLLKGPHGGLTTNVLSADLQSKFNTWVNMELKDGGTQAPPNVLARIVNCLDQQKFQAIGLQNLRTIRRNNENANNCTGCDNAPCRTCHSGDPGSGFVMAIGNAVLPANYTFEQTKLSDPPYLQKYLGVSPAGEPIASNMIKLKAEATAKDKPYTHPMYRLSANQETALQAFVDDAVTKYKAGTCTAPQ